MKKTAILLLSILLILSLFSCRKSEEKVNPEIEKVFNERYVQPSDDLREYAKINDAAAVRVEYSELRRIELISNTDENATLKIIAPDLKPMLLEFINENNEIDDLGAGLATLDEKAKQELSSGNLSFVENIVTVPYSIAEDGSIQINETEEFYDAIYGGLLSFVQSFYSSEEDN